MKMAEKRTSLYPVVDCSTLADDDGEVSNMELEASAILSYESNNVLSK